MAYCAKCKHVTKLPLYCLSCNGQFCDDHCTQYTDLTDQGRRVESWLCEVCRNDYERCVVCEYWTTDHDENNVCAGCQPDVPEPSATDMAIANIESARQHMLKMADDEPNPAEWRAHVNDVCDFAIRILKEKQ